MGQVLHGSATTTEAVRRAIQHSQESLRALAKRHGVNPKTIAKWKSRKSVSDLRTEPKEPRSTVLTIEEEAVVVAFRRHTLLPLDDCLYALQPTIPHLTRSSLHRCLQRHGISRLPQVEGEASPKSKFKVYGVKPLRVLEASSEVVGVDEVAQMGAQQVVRLVEVAFDGCVLDGAVHAFDLAVIRYEGISASTLVRSSGRRYGETIRVLGELRGKVGDGVNQAAGLISATVSIPSLNFIPLTTFGNWF